VTAPGTPDTQYITRPHPLARLVAFLSWPAGALAVLWANLAAIVQAYSPLHGAGLAAAPFRFGAMAAVARILFNPLLALEALPLRSAVHWGAPPGPPSPRAVFFHRWWSFALHHALGAGARWFGYSPLVWELTLNLALFAAAWVSVIAASRSAVFVKRLPNRMATSHWATPRDLGVYRDAAARPGSLPLGTVVSGKAGPGVEIAIPFKQRFQHIEVLGTTGTGKTACVFKPWVLRDGLLNDTTRRNRAVSTVVVDIKHPDIYNDVIPYLAAQKRAVFVLAPDDPVTTMCYNPLDALDPTDTHSYLTDIQMLVRTIVENTQLAEKDVPHHRGIETQMLEQLVQFAYEAETIVTPQLLAQWEEEYFNRYMEPGQRIPRIRSLPFIALLCRLGTDTFLKFVSSIQTDPRIPDKWAARFAQEKTRTKADVTETLKALQRRLAPFLAPAVARITQYSHFRLETIGLVPTTLIISPPSYGSEAVQAFSALIITQLIQILTRLARRSRGIRLPVPVMLYLDEILNQVRIPGLDNSVATLRQYGIGIVLGLQNHSGMFTLYGKDTSSKILDNLTTTIVFGRNMKPDQAEEAERILGMTTTIAHSASSSDRGESLSEHVVKRPLMLSNEISKMAPFQAIVRLEGGHVTRVRMPVMPRRDPETGSWAYEPVEGADVKTACAPLVQFIEELEASGQVDRRFMEPQRSRLRKAGLPDFLMLLTRLDGLGIPPELQPPPLPKGLLILPSQGQADGTQAAASQTGPLEAEIELQKIVEEAARMASRDETPASSNGQQAPASGTPVSVGASSGHAGAGRTGAGPDASAATSPAQAATKPAGPAQDAPAMAQGTAPQGRTIDPERVMDEVRGMYNALLVRRDLMPHTFSPVAWRITGHSAAALAVRTEVIMAYARRRSVTPDRLLSVWQRAGLSAGPARVQADGATHSVVLLTPQAVREDRLVPSLRAKMEAWPTLPASAVRAAPQAAPPPHRPPAASAQADRAAPQREPVECDPEAVLGDVIRWARERRDSLAAPGRDPLGQWDAVVGETPVLLIRGAAVWRIIGQRTRDVRSVLRAWKEAGVLITSDVPSDSVENRFTVIIRAQDGTQLQRGTRYVALRWDELERRGLSRS
jgi:type IV secretory pathway TraG/TraD family ATPase VirD4